GRDVFSLGQDTEFEAEGGGGWGHHAGKLAAANNADYWKSHKDQPTESLAVSRLLPCTAPEPAGFGRLRAGSSQPRIAA
ncbi:MAG: hypothetical protein V7635_1097, partial [Arthrobacter sp.]